MWIKILVTWLFEAQNLNPRPVQTLTVELTHLEVKAPILISQSQESLLVRVKLVLTFPNRSQYSSERIWKINSFIFYVKSPRIQLSFKLVRNNGDVRRLVLKKSVMVEKNNSMLLLYSLHIQGTIFDSADYAESLWKASFSIFFFVIYFDFRAPFGSRPFLRFLQRWEFLASASREKTTRIYKICSEVRDVPELFNYI